MISSVASIPAEPLAVALALVDGVFDDREITSRTIDSTGVVEYYRQSERAYRMFHSGEGALHIGMCDEENSDTSDADSSDVGHGRHPALFAAELESITATRAIEFGCGAGYNVRTLAKQYSAIQFTGVDLSKRHVKAARRDARGIGNVQFEVANYETLDAGDGAYDAVLAIETLCQTTDQSRAISEAFRVLRPGGRLVVIDCFRNGPLDAFDTDLARAALLVEKTAAVDAFAEIDSWRAMVQDVGFNVLDATDRSHETARDLARLYKLARRFFKMSAAVKLIRRAMPPLAMENSVCGLLMPYTVGHGLHGYYSIVLEKTTV